MLVPPETLKLEDYGDDARVLDAEAFRKRHGDGFLVHHSMAGLRPPGGPRQTLVNYVLPDDPNAGPAELEEALAPRATGFFVFPVKKTDRSPVGGFISVGRTRNNDVIIPDISVSKFHAMFVVDTAGKFTLRDAGSRNGTFIDDVPAPSIKDGAAAVPVPAGARVKFGHVDLRFVNAAELRDLVTRMLRRG